MFKLPISNTRDKTREDTYKWVGKETQMQENTRMYGKKENDEDFDGEHGYFRCLLL